MPLYLREEDVERLLTMEQALEAVEEVFRLLGEGRADNRPRQRPRTGHTTLNVMAGAAEGLGLALKAYTVSPGGVRFVVLLWDGESGDLQAVIEAGRLGQLRTGAATGVATRHLARPDAVTVGLLGSGRQARSQLEAVCAVRPVRSVRVYSPTAAHRQGFAGEMSGRLGVEVRPVTAPREAVAEADIVITMTTSRTPVLEAGWLEPGTHLNIAGGNRADAREIDADTIRRAQLVCVDDPYQARIEAGDLLAAVEQGDFAWDRVVDLGSVVAGRVHGRQDPRAVTLFRSTGIAVEDVAVARRVYGQALRAGAGEAVPGGV